MEAVCFPIIKAKQKSQRALFAVLAVFSIILFRVAFGSFLEFRKGTEALAKGDREKGVTHMERAIRWYFPLNPWVEKAAHSIWEIAEEAGKRGEHDFSLTLFRRLRSAFYAVRSFYTPGRKWIEKCDGKIARIMAEDPSASWPDPELSAGEKEKAILSVLQKKKEPDPFWSVLLEAGFLGWIGSVFGLIFSGFDREGKVVPKKAFLWGGMLFFFFALWILGMARA